MDNVECCIIRVDCFPYDINNFIDGDYYGFDFYVDIDKRIEMVNYIIELFSELDIPIIKINYHNTTMIDKNRLYDEEMIKNEVVKNLSVIEEELNKFYKR